MSSSNISPSEFQEAKQSLQARIADGTPSPKAPRALPLRGIELLPEVFQHRRASVEVSEAHVQSLAQAIRRGPRGPKQPSLAPITVYWIGDAWACLDGHHRLAAYHLVEHLAPVPVKALHGITLDEAILVALGDNNKDKLALTPRCRTEAAWRLSFDAVLSKADISRLSGVNESTVAAMRKEKKLFQLAHADTDAALISWAQMRNWRFNTQDPSLKDLTQAKAEQLHRHIGRHLIDASPEVILRALGLHCPGLMAMLVELHTAHSEHEAYRADPFPTISRPMEF